MTVTEAAARFVLVEAQTRRERTLAKSEAALAKKIAALLKRQRKAFLAKVPTAEVQRTGPGAYRVREAVAQPWDDWEAWFTEAELATLAAFVDFMEASILTAIIAGEKVAIAELVLDVSFELDNPRAVAWATERAAEAVSQINDTTREGLRAIITRGVDAGDSYDDIAAAIEQYTGWGEGRAQRIAVYELARAYEEGNRQVADELTDNGQEMEHSWLTAEDDAVCDDVCGPNAAQGWIPLEDAFQSGDDSAPGHNGCRCSTLYRRKGIENT